MGSLTGFFEDSYVGAGSVNSSAESVADSIVLVVGSVIGSLVGLFGEPWSLVVAGLALGLEGVVDSDLVLKNSQFFSLTPQGV